MRIGKSENKQQSFGVESWRFCMTDEFMSRAFHIVRVFNLVNLNYCEYFHLNNSVLNEDYLHHVNPPITLSSFPENMLTWDAIPTGNLAPHECAPVTEYSTIHLIQYWLHRIFHFVRKMFPIHIFSTSNRFHLKRTILHFASTHRNPKIVWLSLNCICLLYSTSFGEKKTPDYWKEVHVPLSNTILYVNLSSCLRIGGILVGLLSHFRVLLHRIQVLSVHCCCPYFRNANESACNSCITQQVT